MIGFKLFNCRRQGKKHCYYPLTGWHKSFKKQHKNIIYWRVIHLCVSMCDWFTASVSLASHQQNHIRKKNFSVRHLLTYPKFAIKIKGIQQFHNVMVVAGGQNVNLYHVILQLILCLCVNNLGSSKGPILLVLSLTTKGGNWLYSHNTEHTNYVVLYLLIMLLNTFLTLLAGLHNDLEWLLWKNIHQH